MHSGGLVGVVDIDECARGSHRCEQVCINNEGSYVCSCFNHHTLLSNLKNCLGKSLSDKIDKTTAMDDYSGLSLSKVIASCLLLSIL